MGNFFKTPVLFMNLDPTHTPLTPEFSPFHTIHSLASTTQLQSVKRFLSTLRSVLLLYNKASRHW